MRLHVGGACAGSGYQAGSASATGPGEETRNPSLHSLTWAGARAIRDAQVTAQIVARLPACSRCRSTHQRLQAQHAGLRAPNEPMQSPHEAFASVRAGGVFAFAGGVGPHVACVAGTTVVSARMQHVCASMQVAGVRMQGLCAAASSEVSSLSVDRRSKRVVEAHATGCVASLYPLSARTSIVDNVRVRSYGVAQHDLRASRRLGAQCVPSCRGCNDTCGQTPRSWAACNPLFAVIRDAHASIPAPGRTISPDSEACTWRRFVRSAHRLVLVSVRYLAHGPKVDLWLAYVGPQGGHEQAQSCPSKHPDGYREVPF